MLGFFGTLSELFDGSLDSAKLGLVVSPTSGQASLVIFSWLSFMVVPGVSGLSVVSGVSDVHLSDCRIWCQISLWRSLNPETVRRSGKYSGHLFWASAIASETADSSANNARTRSYPSARHLSMFRISRETSGTTEISTATVSSFRAR